MGFTSIDNLPCSVFDKIIKNNDTSLLGVKEHAKQWEIIQDELIDTFGVSKEYQMWLRNMSEWVKYLNKAINGGDKSMINFANRFKLEADRLMKEEVNVNNVSKYAVVSKYMGFKINPADTTVLEFYGYIKMMESENNG